jgi:UPF0755 protein
VENDHQEGKPPAAEAYVKKLALWLALGVVSVLLGGGVWFWRYPDQPGPARIAVATVEIPAGTGVVGIKNILARGGVITDDPRFIALAKLMGASKRLKAGEYAFQPGLSPRAVLKYLAAGKTVLHAITLPEGITLFQAADIINAGGWGTREAFLQLATDPGFIGSLGLRTASLEGYLFPDTYFFEKGTGLRAIITTMAKRMTEVLNEEGVPRPQEGSPAAASPGAGTALAEDRGTGPGMSRHEVLILASIIEKETALASERPLVAKVFLTRLRTGMKLQADPTVIYGLAKFGSPLTKDDLDTPNPYNTYVNRGLPVGPICNPGRTSIAAVVKPAPDDYSYFVSQNDGSHYFSKTLAEHNQAVARYRKKRLSNRE